MRVISKQYKTEFYSWMNGMAKLAGSHIHSRLFSDPKKYCVRHDGRADDGEWVTSKDGLRRQFVCMNCLQNEKDRAIMHTAQH